MNFGQMTYANSTDIPSYRNAIYGTPDNLGYVGIPSLEELLTMKNQTIGGVNIQNPVASIVNNSFVAGIQAAATGNNSIL